MSDKLPEPKNEEVDIIQIFNLIGKAFKSFFDFIKSIFEYLLKVFVIFSFFIKRHLLKLMAAAVIGLIAGNISDHFEKWFYTSSMIVQPNFGTNDQLIEKVTLLNQLTMSRDTTALAQILDLNLREAGQILQFGLNPISNANTRLKSFDAFVKGADTLTLQNITFKDYENNLELSDYSRYKITVNSLDRTIYKKIEDKLVEIPISGYVRQLQKTDMENLAKSEMNSLESLVVIDSLRKDYKEVMLQDLRIDESRPKPSGNNIYLASDSKRATNELVLFNLEKGYNEELRQINAERARKQNIINILSGFQEIGISVREVKTKWFVIGALGIAILLLLLIEFNKFLNQQQKKMLNE